MSFLNKNISGYEKNFFALDIGDLSIKALEIRRDGKRDQIRSFGSISLSKGIIDDGRIMEKQKLSAAIKKAIAVSGPKKISTRKVICSIPESKAFLRIINIPRVSEMEAQEAVKWEIEASIPLSVDQVYFDWQFLKESEDPSRMEKEKQSVLTVAVSREIVDDLMEVLEVAGLEVYGLELESVACTRSLIPETAPSKDVYLIADLGTRRTSFIITEGNVPYFTSSVPFSAETLTDAIAKNLGMDLEEAEKTKVLRGIEHSFEDNSLFNVMHPLLENLSQEIERTIDFYGNISKGSAEIKKIILSGGGANLRGMIPYLTTKLSREVVVGDPWVNLRLGDKLPVINKHDCLQYASAIGLALKKIDYGNRH